MSDPFEILQLRFRIQHLVEDIGALTGEPKDQVMVKALEERLARLKGPVSRAERRQRAFAALEGLWSNRPTTKGGASPTPEQENEILGYGPEGV